MWHYVALFVVMLRILAQYKAIRHYETSCDVMWGYVALSGVLWRYMAFYGVMWRYVAVCVAIWRNITLSGVI